MSRSETRWLIGSAPLLLLVVASGHYGYDLPIRGFFSTWDSGVLPFFRAITYLGDSTIYLVVSSALFLFFIYLRPIKRQARRWLYLFSAVAVSGLAANLVKWLLGRWRPNMFSPDGFYGFEFFGVGYGQTSFPSGHATTICALAFALAMLYPRFRWLWAIMALLVASSRVVIGAHYTSDVVMGAYVGILTAFLLWRWPFFQKTNETGREAS